MTDGRVKKLFKIVKKACLGRRRLMVEMTSVRCCRQEFNFSPEKVFA
jgi:hypothetical protein